MLFKNSKPTSRKSVLMSEFSDVRFDARVLKQARTLSEDGCAVKLVMYNSDIACEVVRRDVNLEFTEIPFKTRYITDSPWRRAKRFVSLCFVFLRYLRRIGLSNADFYHAHNSVVGWAVYLSCLMHRGIFVYDCHEILWTEPGIIPKIAVFLEKILMKQARLVLCPSEHRAAILKEHYGLRDKPLPICNYPVFRKPDPADRDRVRLELNLSGNEVILFYSGMLAVETRLQDRIIRALSALPREVVFVIVGFGHEREIRQLEEVARGSHVADRVFIRPPKPHDELIAYTRGADIGVALLKDGGPAYRYHALNKFYEYVAAGLAVVASNFTSFREDIYANPVGRIGSTCNEEDPVEISKSIAELVNDRKLLDQCKTNSTTLFQKYWNWETQGEKLIGAYESLGYVRASGDSHISRG